VVCFRGQATAVVDDEGCRFPAIFPDSLRDRSGGVECLLSGSCPAAERSLGNQARWSVDFVSRRAHGSDAGSIAQAALCGSCFVREFIAARASVFSRTSLILVLASSICAGFRSFEPIEGTLPKVLCHARSSMFYKAYLAHVKIEGTREIFTHTICGHDLFFDGYRQCRRCQTLFFQFFETRH